MFEYEYNSCLPSISGVHASSLEEVADVVYISFGKPELKLCVKVWEQMSDEY